ncbi:MAG: DoxX family protein [Thaumarchaeota archaeon]|jgi:putative oxidoreductase|nr:DoxX family protein [Candidatus Geocrenenecus arthurdayi]MCL7389643.1 DoxX family protein [Candidatus Geocrenenecus arthurdayi]MCL7391090.1 DoxX family protein [Candidatus Geocrenenecus arthurdayi]
MPLLGFLSGYTDLASIAVRVVIGVLMIIHGMPKLAGPSRTQMREGMKRVGVPTILFDLVGLLEFVGGLFLLLGFLTRIVSALFILEMVGTIVLYNTVLWKAPMPRGAFEEAFKRTHGYLFGWELDTTILACMIVTLILGGGALSLDGLLGL